MRHILDLQDMGMDMWNTLYASCCDIMRNPRDYIDAARGKVMASLFYEPSTRTNLSFQTAMLRLGGSVMGFADPNLSSVSKGETLKDTIIMTSSYSDVIVMRNPREGAAKAASLYSRVPVINAGDGGHLHPTQTLTDLTTIMRYRGKIDDMCIGFCGDLKNGRTVHSLIKSLLGFKKIVYYLISPKELALPSYMLKLLQENGQRFYEVSDLEACIPELDVLYMTRIQQERFVDRLEYERLKGVYVLDSRKMQAAKKDMIVLHPLPRVDEITGDMDDDPRAAYFEQARCGMYIRMALLLHVMQESSVRPEHLAAVERPQLCKNDRCITKTERYLEPLTKNVHGLVCCAYCDKEIGEHHHL